jgi:hypothetical protein
MGLCNWRTRGNPRPWSVSPLPRACDMCRHGDNPWVVNARSSKGFWIWPTDSASDLKGIRMVLTDGELTGRGENGIRPCARGRRRGWHPQKRSFAGVGHNLKISPATFALETLETERGTGIAYSTYKSLPKDGILSQGLLIEIMCPM